MTGIGKINYLSILNNTRKNPLPDFQSIESPQNTDIKTDRRDETRSKRHYKKITKEKKNEFNLLYIQIIHGPTSPKKKSQ